MELQGTMKQLLTGLRTSVGLVLEMKLEIVQDPHINRLAS